MIVFSNEMRRSALVLLVELMQLMFSRERGLKVNDG